MANNYYKNSEHAFKTIGKDIKEDNLKNPILLCGEEQYLIYWALEQIVDKYIDPGCQSLDYMKLDREKVTVAEIRENCSTLSMLSKKRVVQLGDFPPVWGEDQKGFTDKELDDLIRYIDDLPESSIFIFTGQDPDGRRRRKSKLYKAIEKSGKVYDFSPLSIRELRSFIVKRFNSGGKKAKPSVVEMIVTESGYLNKEIDYGLYNMENDLKKIIAHSTGDEITASDVALTLSSNPETNVFAMLDAISRNRKDEAFRLLHNLLQAGENIYMLLSLIVSQLELILQTKELKEEGIGLKQIQKTLKVHEFRVKKTASFTDRFTMDDLRKVLIRAYDIDKEIKTGLLQQDLAMELFIAEI